MMLKKIIQYLTLSILGGFGILLIYFASVHSQRITERVESNSKQIIGVLDNQTKILKNQQDKKLMLERQDKEIQAILKKLNIKIDE